MASSAFTFVAFDPESLGWSPDAADDDYLRTWDRLRPHSSHFLVFCFDTAFQILVQIIPSIYVQTLSGTRLYTFFSSLLHGLVVTRTQGPVHALPTETLDNGPLLPLKMASQT